ncbi:hypothetical protein [Candidatus Phytoplasma prunorum]|uniref:hypothetical protein n=1 Tax=Candidatus Phytoplasma prunorum TaxID=47565 RepID=UPI002FF0CDCD
MSKENFEISHIFENKKNFFENINNNKNDKIYLILNYKIKFTNDNIVFELLEKNEDYKNSDPNTTNKHFILANNKFNITLKFEYS